MSNVEFKDSIELTDTQKLGRSMRWYGITRLALILSSFLIAFIASSIVMPTIDLEAEDYLEQYELAMLLYMEQTWVQIYNYVFEAIVVIGLGIFVVNIYPMFKSIEIDDNFKRVYYFFLADLIVSVVTFILIILVSLISFVIWIIMVLQFVIPGLAIAGFFFMRPWSIAFEREMGAQYPIVSSRIRRLFIGEILVLAGSLFTLFSLIISGAGSLSGYLGAFSIIGEVIVGINLLKTGKLLTLDTFPQQQMYPYRSPQPKSSQTYQEEYPEYKPPQKLIPDKAYFCPSCGAKLESISQDFCMKCGKHIPKPKDNE